MGAVASIYLEEFSPFRLKSTSIRICWPTVFLWWIHQLQTDYVFNQNHVLHSTFWQKRGVLLGGSYSTTLWKYIFQPISCFLPHPHARTPLQGYKCLTECFGKYSGLLGYVCIKDPKSILSLQLFAWTCGLICVTAWRAPLLVFQDEVLLQSPVAVVSNSLIYKQCFNKCPVHVSLPCGVCFWRWNF